jgi:23S rRNA (uridine2552-2'-O)-methyltransferase
MFAARTMKQGGNMAMKSFQGEMFHELLEEVKKHFYVVKTFHTKSTRRGSTEIYIVAKNFIGSSGDVEGHIQ